MIYLLLIVDVIGDFSVESVQMVPSSRLFCADWIDKKLEKWRILVKKVSIGILVSLVYYC